VLAVDIGRTKIRTGVVRFNLNAAADIAKAKVWKYELWRHGDEKLSRHEAVEGLVRMLKHRINRAKRANLKLAPLSALDVPERLSRMGRSTPADKICRVTGKVAVLTCRSSSRGHPPYWRA